MLNNNQIKNIRKAEKVLFCTCDKNKKPRGIWVIPSRVEKDKIIISNIQMEQTFKNVIENKKTFINVLLPEFDDLQYKLECEAEIQAKGKLFEEIKKFEESENLPPELKVSAIIVNRILNIQETNG